VEADGEGAAARSAHVVGIPVGHLYDLRGERLAGLGPLAESLLGRQRETRHYCKRGGRGAEKCGPEPQSSPKPRGAEWRVGRLPHGEQCFMEHGALRSAVLCRPEKT